MNINTYVKCYNKYRTVLKHIKKLLPEAITTSNKPFVRPAKYMSLYHLKRMLTPAPKQQKTLEDQAISEWLVAVSAEAEEKTTTGEQYIEFIQAAAAERDQWVEVWMEKKNQNKKGNE